MVSAFDCEHLVSDRCSFHARRNTSLPTPCQYPLRFPQFRRFFGAIASLPTASGAEIQPIFRRVRRPTVTELREKCRARPCGVQAARTFGASDGPNRILGGGQGMGEPAKSMTSTPSGISSSKVEAGGSRLISISRKRISVRFPKRSSMEVPTMSPEMRSATNPSRS